MYEHEQEEEWRCGGVTGQPRMDRDGEKAKANATTANGGNGRTTGSRSHCHPIALTL